MATARKPKTDPTTRDGDVAIRPPAKMSKAATMHDVAVEPGPSTWAEVWRALTSR